MDFSAFPPEVNSGLLYAGPGSEPLLAAASAWEATAAELGTTAAAISRVVGGLTAAWRGPSASTMAQAVTSYASWLTTTAESAELTASQAAAAAAAYETAFAMTVPPAVVAANRAALAVLVATNFLGVNAAAIATNEAQYAEMWAQDAAAMMGYQMSSAAATSGLPTFTPAPQVTTSNAIREPLNSSAAPAQSIRSWLTSPSNFLTALGDPTTPVGFVEAQWLSTASSGPWQAPLFLLTSGLMGQANGMMSRSNDLTDEGNRISERLANTDDQQIGHPVVNPAEAPTNPGNYPKVAERPSFGIAHTAGNLSVPPGWDKATQQVKLASAAAPLPSGGMGGMIPTPIAAVNAPGKQQRKGEEILVRVRFVPTEGL